MRGDLLLSRPGASSPADGVVKEGTSAVNEAMITGESKPMDKSTGDRVIAGTVNGQGSLRIEVTGTGDETALAGIMRLVEQAQTSRSRAQAWRTGRRFTSRSSPSSPPPSPPSSGHS